MEKYEYERFSHLFFAFMTMYPSTRQLSAKASANLAAFYFKGLKELSYDRVVEIFQEIANTSSWMPTLSELRTIAGLQDEMDDEKHRNKVANDLFDRLITPQPPELVEGTENETHFNGKELRGFWKMPKNFNRKVLGENYSWQRLTFSEMGGSYFFNALDRSDPREVEKARKQWVRTYSEVYLREGRKARKLIGEGLSHDESQKFLNQPGIRAILGDLGTQGSRTE